MTFCVAMYFLYNLQPLYISALLVPDSDDAVYTNKGTTKELVVVPPSEVVQWLPGCQNQQSRSCSYHVWSRYVYLLRYLDGVNCQLLTKCITLWRWPLTFSSLRLASLHKVVNCSAVFLTLIRSQYWFHTCIDYATLLSTVSPTNYSVYKPQLFA